MRTTLSLLLPSRFLTTVGHIMATIMVHHCKDGNILRAMPLRDTSSYNDHNTSLTAALAITWMCFIIEMTGLVMGSSMFKEVSNLLCKNSLSYPTFPSFLTFISKTSLSMYPPQFALSLFITEAWHYGVYWYIAIFCK
ncbi:transmembrane protein-domain-containing protein [Chytridium lagenaria]|nr:transmembrane protein-domain-containing protein [Chytridium lagenaria]